MASPRIEIRIIDEDGKMRECIVECIGGIPSDREGRCYIERNLLTCLDNFMITNLKVSLETLPTKGE